jgi:hypothetical protein
MMHRAILIKSCQRYRARREACDSTWAGVLRQHQLPVFAVEGNHPQTRLEWGGLMAGTIS